jgi:hypothetical protein
MMPIEERRMDVGRVGPCGLGLLVAHSAGRWTARGRSQGDMAAAYRYEACGVSGWVWVLAERGVAAMFNDLAPI